MQLNLFVKQILQTYSSYTSFLESPIMKLSLFSDTLDEIVLANVQVGPFNLKFLLYFLKKKISHLCKFELSQSQ